MLSMLTGKKRTEFLPAESLGIRIHTEEHCFVDKGVLLLRPRAFLMFLVGGADY
jgi:hypothetical protein